MPNMEIRNIDRAGRLYDRAAVTRMAMRSLLWGIPLYFLGAFGATVFVASENLPLSEWPQALAGALAVAIGIFALTMATLWTGGKLARGAACVIAILSALWVLEAILFVSTVAPAGSLWLMTALARVPIVFWISLEIAVGAVALLIAAKRDLLLVREPAGTASLTGAPPALAYLTRNRTAKFLFILAAFLFGMVFFQFTGLINSAAQSWNVAVKACGSLSDPARADCFARIGIGDLSGQFIIWPLALVLLLVASRLARRAARRRTIVSAIQVMLNDKRERILFLRWFRNDHGQMRLAWQTPLGRLLGSTILEPTIDRMLIENYSLIGPTWAIGNPDSHKSQDIDDQLSSIWNIFPSERDWQTHIKQMAHDARAIVMMIDVASNDGVFEVSDGVKFELGMLSDPALKTKTLLLAGSQSVSPEAHARVWSSVKQLNGTDVPIEIVGGSRALGAFHLPDGTLAVATSHRFSRSDYAMTLRWFFASLPAASKISNAREIAAAN